jgi:hypothetical protein
MSEHHDRYWRTRLATLSKRPTRNRFEVAIAADPAEAGAVFRNRFLPKIAPRSSIMEKSFPPGRIRIVLINADMGL